MSKSGAARSTIAFVSRWASIRRKEERYAIKIGLHVDGWKKDTNEVLLSIRCTHVLSDVRDENFVCICLPRDVNTKFRGPPGGTTFQRLLFGGNNATPPMH